MTATSAPDRDVRQSRPSGAGRGLELHPDRLLPADPHERAIASPHLNQPDEEVAGYRSALLERFANPRIHHQLAQIGADGSQRLPIRVLPVLRAERGANRMPEAATRILAAWICCLRGLGAPVSDVRSQELLPLAAGPLSDAVPRLLDALDPELGADAEVIATVVQQSEQLSSKARS